ncbi:hypothetical protein QQX98_001017 [Neonectria punicea]|uniref:MYND-type domain-containing protein n=1 Tax=Neonectria punicea TaxID=979145 RepID=A0ABR1HRV5_9HYPO
MSLACVVCQKTSAEGNIKRCAKCSTTPYCSRECQKRDWKAHKKICGKTTVPPGPSAAFTPARPGLSPPKGLDKPISRPFTHLDNNTWLCGRSEKDVFRLLIDSYRLRVDDDYTFDGDVPEDSVYSGAPNSLRDFQRYLAQVQSRTGLLPEWWSPEKKTECERFGMDSSQWQNLLSTAEKADIIDHYGDPQFPMQLRMFAEAVLGSGPGGTDGTAMRAMMMSMEGGSLPAHSHMSVVDSTTGNVSHPLP